METVPLLEYKKVIIIVITLVPPKNAHLAAFPDLNFGQYNATVTHENEQK